jgi:hypothetical protein
MLTCCGYIRTWDVQEERAGTATCTARVREKHGGAEHGAVQQCHNKSFGMFHLENYFFTSSSMNGSNSGSHGNLWDIIYSRFLHTDRDVIFLMRSDVFFNASSPFIICPSCCS